MKIAANACKNINPLRNPCTPVKLQSVIYNVRTAHVQQLITGQLILGRNFGVHNLPKNEPKF